jgi:hypothetical protein
MKKGMLLTYWVMLKWWGFLGQMTDFGRTLIGRFFRAWCSAYGRIHHQTSSLLSTLDSYGLHIVACAISMHVFTKNQMLETKRVRKHLPLSNSDISWGGIDAVLSSSTVSLLLSFQKNTVRWPHSHCLLPLLAPAHSHLLGHYTRLGLWPVIPTSHLNLSLRHMCGHPGTCLLIKLDVWLLLFEVFVHNHCMSVVSSWTKTTKSEYEILANQKLEWIWGGVLHSFILKGAILPPLVSFSLSIFFLYTYNVSYWST